MFGNKGIFLDKKTFLQSYSEFLNPQHFRLFESLVNCLNEEVLELWYFEILELKYKDFKNFLEALRVVFNTQAKERAKKAKIKGFEGGRFEEVRILEQFFYQQEIAKLPQWFKREN